MPRDPASTTGYETTQSQLQKSYQSYCPNTDWTPAYRVSGSTLTHHKGRPFVVDSHTDCRHRVRCNQEENWVKLCLNMGRTAMTQTGSAIKVNARTAQRTLRLQSSVVPQVCEPFDITRTKPAIDCGPAVHAEATMSARTTR